MISLRLARTGSGRPRHVPQCSLRPCTGVIEGRFLGYYSSSYGVCYSNKFASTHPDVNRTSSSCLSRIPRERSIKLRKGGSWHSSFGVKMDISDLDS